jgi:SSS family solute:Na+ symporter
LIAAIIASTASKIKSIATIFTLDIYAKLRHDETRAEDDAGREGQEKRLVLIGRIAAVVAIILAILTARPLLGSLDQAFQYIQEFSGFVTPGITVIFLLGLFWPRATEAGALVGAIASVVLSFIFWFPAEWGGIAALNAVPFLNRMSIVFFLSLALAVVVSLARPARVGSNRISMEGVSFRTTTGFNIAALIVCAILVFLYATFW